MVASSADEEGRQTDVTDGSKQSEESKSQKGGLLNVETTDSLRAQIRELSDKLIFANETIAMMEEETNKIKKNAINVGRESQSDTEEDNVANTSAYSEPSEKQLGRMINKVQIQAKNSMSTVLDGQD